MSGTPPPSADPLWDDGDDDLAFPAAAPGAEAEADEGAAWEGEGAEAQLVEAADPSPSSNSRLGMAAALEDFFAAILSSLADGAVPDLDLACLRPGNATAGGATGAATTLGARTSALSLTGRGGRGAARYARLLLAGAAAYEALSTGRCLTQRDLYYSMKSVGAALTPAAAASAVTDLTALFRAPRGAFGVVAAPRGAVGGQAWVAGGGSAGEACWCDVAAEPAGRPLPGDPAALAALAPRTAAAFLLVIEKDAVFRRLCEDRIWERLPGGAVLVTSCGWPAVGVRAFIASMREAAAPAGALHTVLGVCDWNPAGVGILCAYKFGTRRGAVGGRGGGGGGGDDAGAGDGGGGGDDDEEPAAAAGGGGVDPHAIPGLAWLGLRSPRLAPAPPAAFQPLSARDRSMAATLSGGALAAYPAWTDELDVMVASGLKAELEAVDAVGGLGSLTEALVADVCAGAWAA